MGTPLRLLIVEDSADDATLLLREIKREGYEPDYERVETEQDMEAALDRKSWDLVVSDYVLPRFSGMEALKLLQKKGLDLPFIIVSGKISEETAVLAMKSGAHDYIMKSNLKCLAPAIKREIQEAEIRKKRKMAEALLADYQKDLRSLASELSLAEERERRRIAIDLHDRISQNLAFCVMRLESLKKSASGNIESSVNELCAMLRQVTSETRSLTFELSPPALYDMGIEAAIEELADKILETHGISFEYDDDTQPKPIDDDVRVLLFQSVRELLVNVVKHAKAHKVTISVSRTDNKIKIVVADDGVGFDTSILSGARKAGGFGIFSIRERINHIGGSMAAQSKSGYSTSITLLAPLKKDLNSCTPNGVKKEIHST